MKILKFNIFEAKNDDIVKSISYDEFRDFVTGRKFDVPNEKELNMIKSIIEPLAEFAGRWVHPDDGISRYEYIMSHIRLNIPNDINYSNPRSRIIPNSHYVQCIPNISIHIIGCMHIYKFEDEWYIAKQLHAGHNPDVDYFLIDGIDGLKEYISNYINPNEITSKTDYTICGYVKHLQSQLDKKVSESLTTSLFEEVGYEDFDKFFLINNQISVSHRDIRKIDEILKKSNYKRGKHYTLEIPVFWKKIKYPDPRFGDPYKFILLDGCREIYKFNNIWLILWKGHLNKSLIDNGKYHFIIANGENGLVEFFNSLN